MINKIKSSQKTKFFLRKSLLFLFLLSTVFQNTISETEHKKNKTSPSLPKIIVLQTYKDWSSRLGTNQTTPQSTTLVFEESKEILTTDYGSKSDTKTSTEKTIDKKFESLKDLITSIKKENKSVINVADNNRGQINGQISAHNVAAQVLSKILQITPLLALASNGVPQRRINFTKNIYESEEDTNIKKEMPSIEALNEVDIDSDTLFKSDRMSASGISFPTTTPMTTTLNIPIFEEKPTEPPTDYTEQPPHNDDDQEHHHENSEPEEGGEHEEQSSPETHEYHDDYEDDEELESFRYPVKVMFHEPEEDGNAEREGQSEGPPPFLMPDLNLNPESLKQKGCRTVVKEVQAIPVMRGGLKQNIQNPNNLIKRIKRNVEDNSRKFTSIVMTKECHFPGDEGAAGSAQNPQTIPNTAMSGTTPELIFQTPSPPSEEEYDEDFDFRAKSRYSSALIDRMEPKSSNDRKSYADNPLFRRDNSDFGFDEPNFRELDDEDLGHKNNRKRRPKHKRKGLQMNPLSDGQRFDDEDFGPQPKTKQNSRTKLTPLYSSDGNKRQRQTKDNKKGKKKPKTVNRSFAFFRKAEPKDKDPNESDYSVSYGRGNFQSFSDSYDSDKDGPRKKGKNRSSSRHDFDDDDDDI